jgi:hypothetical protein
VSEPRYPYVHLDLDPEQVDEMSASLFELGAETCSEHSNFGSDPIGHGHGKTEPVQKHALAEWRPSPVL